MDVDKLNVEVTEFIVKCIFAIKLDGRGGVVVFVAKKNREKKRNRREKEKSRSSNHKLNITHRFTNISN